MNRKRVRVFALAAGLLTVGFAVAAMVTSNGTLRIWRGTLDSGGAARPVTTQPVGTLPPMRLVANVAEPVISTQPAVNSQYRLTLGVLFARSATPDCNTNGTADPLDIQSHTSADCDTNGTPDECEGNLGPCIQRQPVGIVICRGNEGPICVVACGTGPFTYAWYRVPDTDVKDTHDCARSGAPGEYYVIVSNPCGSVESDHVQLVAVPSGSGDGNGDGAIDGQDVQGMVDALLRSGPPQLNDCAYDMNTDGSTNPADVPRFLAALLP